MHHVFSKDLELVHQMCTQTLGDKSSVVAPSEQEEILPVLREERTCQEGVGRGRGTNRERFQGHLYPFKR